MPSSPIFYYFTPYLMENDNSMLAAMAASWSEERERKSTIILGALALQLEAVDSCVPSHTDELFKVFSPRVSNLPHAVTC